MRRTIGWRTAIVEKLQLCLDCQENPSETVGEPGFAHVERLRSEPSLQIKQTISSSFSSSCNARKISSTTVRSSAFSLAKFFCNLLGTEQPLWSKKLFSGPQSGLHMAEARPHEPQVLPRKVSQAMSGLCSLQLDLTQHDWVCIPPEPAWSCSPTGSAEVLPESRELGGPPGHWAGLSAMGPAGTWAAAFLCQCCGRGKQRPRSIPNMRGILCLPYSKPLKRRKPKTQQHGIGKGEQMLQETWMQMPQY